MKCGIVLMRPATFFFLYVVAAMVFPLFAAAATLSGSFAQLLTGTNVNLTVAGGLDWVHWGLGSAWTVERKYGVAQQITNTFLVPSGPYFNYYDGPFQFTSGTSTFSWTDGIPAMAVTNTSTGVYIYGDKYSGNNPTGYQIQCPADTTLKQLRIYVGSSGIKGTLNAILNGATTYTDSSLNGAVSNGVYTINFQADSTGQMLTVTLTSSDATGFLTLEAATLTGPDVPPTVTISSPANGSVFLAPATFSLTAVASDGDGIITNLLLLNGSTVLAQTNSGSLTMTVSNLMGGTYNFVSVATDNAGLSVTSFPAQIFVTTGSGILNGSVASPPTSLSLTGEGTLDWAHWGLASANSFDHKAGVTQVVPDVAPLNVTTNEFLRYADNFTGYSWTDGVPTATATSSTTGIFIYNTNQPPGAFLLTVPATNSLCRLKVYVGLYSSHARMDAWLSDSSAVPYSDESLASEYSNAYAVYTFDYRSTNVGATFNVRWSPGIILDPFYGNVTWQAATLSQPPQAPVLTGPGFLQTNVFVFSFFAQSGANYTVSYSDSLSPANWQVLSNFPGTGNNVIVSNVISGSLTRFYRVQVQ